MGLDSALIHPLELRQAICSVSVHLSCFNYYSNFSSYNALCKVSQLDLVHLTILHFHHYQWQRHSTMLRVAWSSETVAWVRWLVAYSNDFDSERTFKHATDFDGLRCYENELAYSRRR